MLEIELNVRFFIFENFFEKTGGIAMKILYYIKGYLLLSVLGLSTAWGQYCNVSDSLALVQFYQATNGANWAVRWDLKKNVSSWEGVRLENGKVVYLALQTNNLKGSLPNLNLPELRTLKLGFNQLYGTIPNFTYLSKLKDLYLCTNKLTGNAPEFTFLKNLTELDLSNNQLSGNIPDFHLQKLKTMNLAANYFSGNVPTLLFMGASIQKVNLSSNRLSGSMPGFVGLYQLEDLDVSNNQISGNLPNYNKETPILKSLNLSKNKFYGSIPDYTGLAKLQMLNLSQNNLTGAIPEFVLLPSLHELDLSYNQLTGSIPSFKNVSRIEMIDLSKNRLTFEGAEQHFGKHYIFKFGEQETMKLEQYGNILRAVPGGNIQNVYYTWYKGPNKDTVIAGSIRGDGSIMVTTSGTYSCVVKHTLYNIRLESAPTQLIVKSDDVVAEKDPQQSANTRIVPKAFTYKTNSTINITVPTSGSYIIKILDIKNNTLWEENHKSEQRKVIPFQLKGVTAGKYRIKITGARNWQQLFWINVD